MPIFLSHFLLATFSMLVTRESVHYTAGEDVLLPLDNPPNEENKNARIIYEEARF